MQQNWKYKAYPQKQVEKLAARVKSEWLAYKDREKITQSEFANRLSVSQPALNQFLSGTTPMSNEMIIRICHELSVSPTKIVKGLSFYEPFFNTLITQRLVYVRYKVGARKFKEQTVTGAAVHYHPHVSQNVDVYAIEIADSTYTPRYYKGEKVIVAALEPKTGDEVFVRFVDNNSCIGHLKEDSTVESSSTVSTAPSEFSVDDDNVEFVRKVVGMSK